MSEQMAETDQPDALPCRRPDHAEGLHWHPNYGVPFLRPADPYRVYGVARNVAADGFVNPGHVTHAAHREDAERKAALFGGVAVTRTVTEWKPTAGVNDRPGVFLPDGADDAPDESKGAADSPSASRPAPAVHDQPTTEAGKRLAAYAMLAELDASTGEWDAIPEGQRLHVNADYWPSAENGIRPACPTCEGLNRETVDTVCPTCGFDYSGVCGPVWTLRPESDTYVCEICGAER